MYLADLWGGDYLFSGHFDYDLWSFFRDFDRNLLNSFDERLFSSMIQFVSIRRWLQWLMRLLFFLRGHQLFGGNILKSCLALQMRLVLFIYFLTTSFSHRLIFSSWFLLFNYSYWLLLLLFHLFVLNDIINDIFIFEILTVGQDIKPTLHGLSVFNRVGLFLNLILDHLLDF